MHYSIGYVSFWTVYLWAVVMINTGCGRGFTGGLKYLLRNASRNKLDGKRTALIGGKPEQRCFALFFVPGQHLFGKGLDVLLAVITPWIDFDK